MAGSTFGRSFRIMTFGESHGKAVGVVIDGVKPGLELNERIIQKELDRRRPGQSNVTTARAEKDEVEILSGIFEEKTTGAPICLIVRNTEYDSSAYESLKDVFRPGHADFTFLRKFGIRDYRGGGRSSGRETVARVAAGAVAKQILRQRGISITAYTKEIAGIKAEKFDLDEIEKNKVKCPDRVAAGKMEEEIIKAVEEGDSVGGVVEIVADGVPTGLGDPVFDKLSADIAKALMSIGAVKGIEIGAGFRVAEMRGSENNDAFIVEKGEIRTKTNNAGGILGGISNGMPIVARIAVKPTSSISRAQETVDINSVKKTIRIEGRHDPCLCPRIVPVAESMVTLVLLDHLLRHEAMRGEETSLDHLREEIDFIDVNIVDLLAQREAVVEDIKLLKKDQTVRDREREETIIAGVRRFAKELDLNEIYIEDIFRKIIKHSVRLHEE
jgi:chorismate synthase